MRAAPSRSGQQCVGGLCLLQSPAVPTCARALLEWPNPEGRSEWEERAAWGMLQCFFCGTAWGKEKFHLVDPAFGYFGLS